MYTYIYIYIYTYCQHKKVGLPGPRALPRGCARGVRRRGRRVRSTSRLYCPYLFYAQSPY